MKSGPCLCATEPYCKGLCKRCYRAAGYKERTKNKPRVRRAPGPPDCHPDRKHMARGLCAPCYQRFQKQRDPERYREIERRQRAKRLPRSRAAIRRWSLWQKFRITPEQFDAMLVEQRGVCALCDRPERTLAKRLAVDHDHATSVVRGLLCGPCNVVLGYIENERWFARASAYLARHKARGAA